MYPKNHYYSPITTQVDESAYSRIEFPGVDLRTEEQKALLEKILSYPKITYTRYPVKSTVFPHADAYFLSAFLREFRPRRVIEVGSGHSTGVTLDTIDSRFFDLEFTIIDPSMNRVKSSWDTSSVKFASHSAKVQDVDISLFANMDSGDLLFIDSSHVLKTGSDVLYLYLDVLPQLQSGVFIHAHDVFWPFEYPRDWVKEGRSWNEIYLIRALLMTGLLEIVLWPSYLMKDRLDLSELQNTGSIYLRKK